MHNGKCLLSLRTISKKCAQIRCNLTGSIFLQMSYRLKQHMLYAQYFVTLHTLVCWKESVDIVAKIQHFQCDYDHLINQGMHTILHKQMLCRHFSKIKIESPLGFPWCPWGRWGPGHWQLLSSYCHSARPGPDAWLQNTQRKKKENVLFYSNYGKHSKSKTAIF